MRVAASSAYRKIEPCDASGKMWSCAPGIRAARRWLALVGILTSVVALQHQGRLRDVAQPPDGRPVLDAPVLNRAVLRVLGLQGGRVVAAVLAGEDPAGGRLSGAEAVCGAGCGRCLGSPRACCHRPRRSPRPPVTSPPCWGTLGRHRAGAGSGRGRRTGTLAPPPRTRSAPASSRRLGRVGAAHPAARTYPPRRRPPPPRPADPCQHAREPLDLARPPDEVAGGVHDADRMRGAGC